MARYATYLRRSSLGEEDKNYSIDDQRDNVRAWGDSNGHTFAAEYSDPGGKSYKLNRPVFQQMLRDAKDGKFDLVVVGRWDRFSRMQDQQSRAIDQFKGYGVEVVSATQPTAPGPMGTLMRNLHGFVSESELYHIRERMLGGRRKRIYAGKILTSSYPLYGYEWGDPEKGKRSYYVEDGETAPVVRLIFALVLAGMTIRGVTVKLEKDGVPTPMQTNASRGRLPKNKPMSSIWRISTLHRILSNPAYCGRHSAWRRQNLETTTIDPATGIEVDRVQRVERPEDHEDRVWFGHDVCPPLVSEADFQTVQALLARNKQNAPRNLRDPEAGLLRGGIAVCGYCGRNMSVKFVQANGYYRYFCCSGTDVPAARALCEGAGYSWRTEELDKPAWDWVRFQFENPDLLRAKFAEWQADQQAGRTIEYDQLKSLDAQIARAERRRNNFLASMADAEDEDDRVEYKFKAEQEKKSIRVWIEDREKLAVVLGELDSFNAEVESLVAAGGRAKVNMEAADFATKRFILRAFRVQVVVRRKPDFEQRWALSTPVCVPPRLQGREDIVFNGHRRAPQDRRRRRADQDRSSHP